MVKEIEFYRNEKAEYIGRMLGCLVIKKTVETITFATFNDDDVIIRDVLADSHTEIIYCKDPLDI